MSRGVSYLELREGNLVQFKNEENKLGEGSFGIVYNGVYCETPVAVKNLKIMKNEEAERRIFLLEILTLSKLRHPNIVSTIGVTDELIVMERYDGNAMVIPSYGEMALIARDCMRGLCYMHRHGDCIMHGDIKPENILVNRDAYGNVYRAVLGDVGLSRSCKAPSVYTGTPGFMPDTNPTDRMNDVFALAVSLLDGFFQNVHTKFPGTYKDDNTFEFANQTPSAFKEVLSLMLATVQHHGVTSAMKDDMLSGLTALWQSIIDESKSPRRVKRRLESTEKVEDGSLHEILIGTGIF